ncbi:hypothetical protein MHBO_000483 [Bonamia ostreae]|uniref:Uncharacterized protein n=1 Tax=Bonamia ostreae TaxID=126728 RepID=A0ABV2AFU0_9EUKA
MASQQIKLKSKLYTHLKTFQTDMNKLEVLLDNSSKDLPPLSISNFSQCCEKRKAEFKQIESELTTKFNKIEEEYFKPLLYLEKTHFTTVLKDRNALKTAKSNMQKKNPKKKKELRKNKSMRKERNLYIL